MENKRRPSDSIDANPVQRSVSRARACVREIRETLQGVELPFPDQGPRKKQDNDDDKGFKKKSKKSVLGVVKYT
jgi:hypothetical protein